MRHSSPTLTANIYTDPRLLDVQGAVEALPSLSLSGDRNPMSESFKATGTDPDRNSALPPVIPLGTAQSGHSESIPVTLAEQGEQSPDCRADSENSVKPTKKARILTEKDSGLESGRHDLNMRLPAPKAGGNAHETNENDRFQGSGQKASATASPSEDKTEYESPTEASLLTALAMIERLPLTDAEKAEAVRRLLAAKESRS